MIEIIIGGTSGTSALGRKVLSPLHTCTRTRLGIIVAPFLSPLYSLSTAPFLYLPRLLAFSHIELDPLSVTVTIVPLAILRTHPNPNPNTRHFDVSLSPLYAHAGSRACFVVIIFLMLFVAAVLCRLKYVVSSNVYSSWDREHFFDTESGKRKECIVYEYSCAIYLGYTL